MNDFDDALIQLREIREYITGHYRVSEDDYPELLAAIIYAFSIEQAKTFEMKRKLEKCQEAIIKLKEQLGESGQYSIIRTDRNPMSLPESIFISNLLEKIDETLLFRQQPLFAEDGSEVATAEQQELI